ncbi:hypothetical protein BEP19_08120 [Ammoniphilus oxalaticus]|uniref:Translocation protein TolB n=1 Tax=Ammoniphilus oxalaticus TaxID=66863 RepID=A0A419SL23_9BACL|nr:PD40 domain-containing protein [Ammoniphilus oxalaticus]RKD24701.1 hypothetical protein BEP19_08120 [Ammoniphilus oxalaticus]
MNRLFRIMSMVLLVCCFFGGGQVDAENTLKAAFVRDGHLWIKQGEQETQITKEGFVWSPVWSRDGKWIAYLKSAEEFGEGIVWVYNSETEKNFNLNYQGENLQWAPHKNLLAFQPQLGINVTELQGDEPGKTADVARGVNNFSWLPDGKGFLASADANLLPDGWTNPILYKIKLEKDLQPSEEFANATRYFTIPSPLKKGGITLPAIGTSKFAWSPDQKWIAFLVSPTASWSMDSNLLCVLSADGKTFEVLDEMAAGFPFSWAPTKSKLGYIEGEGRIVFGFRDKNLKVQEFTVAKSLELTPDRMVDLAFAWKNNNHVIVSRASERDWSNQPSERVFPQLFQIDLHNKEQKQLSFPPNGYGDFNPEFLESSQKLTWTRSNWETNDIWISATDGTSARKWIQNVSDQSSISWFETR